MPGKEFDLQGLLQKSAQEIDCAQSDPNFIFTPLAQLGQEFGYTESGTKRVLQRTGISELKGWIIEQQRQNFPEPTEELAWLLGYSSGSNAFDTNRNMFELHDTNSERTKKLVTAMTFVVGIQPTVRNFENRYGKTKKITARNKTAVSRIGNLSADAVSETMSKRYPQIIGNKQLRWKFLEGVYDRRGGKYSAGIAFSTGSEEFAQFLIDTLIEAGINKPILRTLGGKIVGVGIHNDRDLNILTDSISPISEKGAFLKQFKTPEKCEIIEARECVLSSQDKPSSLKAIIARRKVREFHFNKSQVESALGFPLHICEGIFTAYDMLMVLTTQDNTANEPLAQEKLAILDFATRLFETEPVPGTDLPKFIKRVHLLIQRIQKISGVKIDSFSPEEIYMIADFAKAEIDERFDRKNTQYADFLASIILARTKKQKNGHDESNGCSHAWSYDPFHGGRMNARCMKCGIQKVVYDAVL